jgi:hypothetical protein
VKYRDKHRRYNRLEFGRKIGFQEHRARDGTQKRVSKVGRVFITNKGF